MAVATRTPVVRRCIDFPLAGEDSVTPPECEGACESRHTVGQAGGGGDFPAFLIRGDPGDGVAEEVGHADPEKGSGEEGVSVDGNEQPGGGVLKEGGVEEGRRGHEPDDAERADGEEIPDAVGDQEDGDGNGEAEEGFDAVELTELHCQGAEPAEAGRGDEEPEPAEADAEKDLAEELVAGETLEEILGFGGFEEHEGVEGDQP